MTALTLAERKWVDKLQKVLDACPSERLGFYSIGDPTVFIYDKDAHSQVCDQMDQCDLVLQIDRADTGFDEYLIFPGALEGVCG